MVVEDCRREESASDLFGRIDTDTRKPQFCFLFLPDDHHGNIFYSVGVFCSWCQACMFRQSLDVGPIWVVMSLLCLSPNLVPGKDSDAEALGEHEAWEVFCKFAVFSRLIYALTEGHPYRNTDGSSCLCNCPISVTIANHLAFHNIFFSSCAVSSNTCCTVLQSLGWQKIAIP